MDPLEESLIKPLDQMSPVEFYGHLQGGGPNLWGLDPQKYHAIWNLQMPNVIEGPYGLPYQKVVGDGTGSGISGSELSKQMFEYHTGKRNDIDNWPPSPGAGTSYAPAPWPQYDLPSYADPSQWMNRGNK